eukprot:4763901-Pleurochrysis_carterae.AAC.2
MVAAGVVAAVCGMVLQQGEGVEIALLVTEMVVGLVLWSCSGARRGSAVLVLAASASANTVTRAEYSDGQIWCTVRVFEALLHAF